MGTDETRRDQVLHALGAEVDAVVVAAEGRDILDRARAEQARHEFTERLRALAGSEVTLSLVGGQQVRGTIAVLGADWLGVHPVAGADGTSTVVPIIAIATVRQVGRLEDPWMLADTHPENLTGLLRRVARARRELVLDLLAPAPQIRGTLDVVGADYVEVRTVEHPRRPDTWSAPTAVRIGSLVSIRLATGGVQLERLW